MYLLIIILILFGMVVFAGAPYVPSRKKYVVKVFEHFRVGSEDVVVDVGSGDGVVLRVASAYGARAIGYEINPVLVAVSRMLSARDPLVTTILANVWAARVPDDVTIFYAFSVSRDEKRLTKLVQRTANMTGRPLKLLCLGSPFKKREADEYFDAYALYIFRPLQSKKA